MSTAILTTQAPSEPGRYNIVVEGVHTFLPLFAEFDGAKWDKSVTGWQNMGHKVYYFPNKSKEQA